MTTTDERAAVGAQDGFDEFARGRGDDLRRLAFLLTSSRHDAEDLVQTALMHSLAHWSRISASEEPYAYVRTVLVNTRRGWWRKERGRTNPVADVPERSVTDTASSYAVRADMHAALASLSAGQRKVVVLRFYEDLSEAETARVLGCTVGTVKSQTARALDRLRTVVGPSREAYLNDGSDS